MVSATEDGKWVSYVYQNPENGGIVTDHTGALEYKHVWLVRHDDLLFASGWHISADGYTQFVVDETIARYHTDGLEATLAYYNSPDSFDAQWYVFIATPRPAKYWAITMPRTAQCTCKRCSMTGHSRQLGTASG